MISGGAGLMKEHGGPGRYRIGKVARMTGLSPHTIRVWERRYGTVHPARSEGGGRLYSEDELTRLRLLVRLQKSGHAIGTVARLPLQELEQMDKVDREKEAAAPPPAAPGPPLTEVVEAILSAVDRLDLAEAEHWLGRATAALDTDTLVLELFTPLLQAIGNNWEQKRWTIAQEHAASALIRNQTSALLHARRHPSPRGKALATTPPGELHEFGALLAAIVASGLGWDTMYLGPNLPVEEIVESARRSQPDLVLLSSVCGEPDAVRQLLGELRAALPVRVRLLAGGAAAQAARGHIPGIEVLGGFDSLRTALS